MRALTEVETDGLVEIFNIAIGRAAASLGRSVSQPISLSVPALQFVPLAESQAHLEQTVGMNVCGVNQRFEGVFDTEATLIFPRDRVLEIVGMWIGEPMTNEELTELEEETLAEIGNVVLYACFGSIANMLHGKFSGSLPAVRYGTPAELLGVAGGGKTDTILITLIDFKFARHDIQGYLCLLMDEPAVGQLIACVDRFIDNPDA